MNKLAVPVTSMVFMVLIIGFWHYYWTRIPNPPKPMGGDLTVQVRDFDDFQDSLAQRVKAKYGGTDNGAHFSVAVAHTSYPAGTVLDALTQTPADFRDCVPPAIPSFTASRLFPTYHMKSDIAVLANLGEKAIEGLGGAGVDLTHNSELNYSVEDVQSQIMDSASIEAIEDATSACGRFLVKHPGLRLVRGVIIGKISFTVSVDNPAKVQAKLNDLGGLTVKDDPGSSSVTVSDKKSEPVVLLLSTLSSSGSFQQPIKLEAVNRPPPNAATRRVYVQQDSSDTSGLGSRVVSAINSRTPELKVVQKIEKLPSEKMPDLAQVRFGNSADSQEANKVLSVLQTFYPRARAVRLGLAAANGQIEVWLPRAGSPTQTNLQVKDTNAGVAVAPATTPQPPPTVAPAVDSQNNSNKPVRVQPAQEQILGFWKASIPLRKSTPTDLTIHIAKVEGSQVTGWFMRGKSPSIPLEGDSSLVGSDLTLKVIFTNVYFGPIRRPDYPAVLRLTVVSGQLKGTYAEANNTGQALTFDRCAACD
ncbi:hypothetical protein [Acidipila sp. EB88]|uniref:hypothetical protein n=1 Tax=Acidipila sp. EB88 TaxID=2305226 RepID=UPI000F60077D|nr:hypothetical protein [Acidipila sp. EB88]